MHWFAYEKSFPQLALFATISCVRATLWSSDLFRLETQIMQTWISCTNLFPNSQQGARDVYNLRVQFCWKWKSMWFFIFALLALTEQGTNQIQNEGAHRFNTKIMIIMKYICCLDSNVLISCLILNIKWVVMRKLLCIWMCLRVTVKGIYSHFMYVDFFPQ